MQAHLIVIACLFLSACSTGSTSDTSNEGSSATQVDITDKVFTSRSRDCASYVDSYKSSATDVNRSQAFTGSLTIISTADSCVFHTNAIPNHDFNDGEHSFVNSTEEQDDQFEVTNSPSFAANTTAISLTMDNAIFLNGVKLDLLAAGCYGVSDGKIGCHNSDQPWRYDPMSELADFGTDSHNAHTQPDGTYHYHGNPNALFYANADIVSPVIGFAADGYPIYGSYFSDEGIIRAAKSSYQLKSGNRTAINSINPGGSYDGTYVDDYEYIEGSGDLDECNGMTIDELYGYYVTSAYPWVLACFKGTPDSSFLK